MVRLRISLAAVASSASAFDVNTTGVEAFFFMKAAASDFSAGIQVFLELAREFPDDIGVFLCNVGQLLRVLC